MKRSLGLLLTIVIFSFCSIQALSAVESGREVFRENHQIQKMKNSSSLFKQLSKKRTQKKEEDDPEGRVILFAAVSLLIIGLIIPIGFALSNLGGIIVLILLGVPLSLFFGIRALILGLKNKKNRDHQNHEKRREKGKIGMILTYLALLANIIFIGYTFRGLF